MFKKLILFLVPSLCSAGTFNLKYGAGIIQSVNSEIVTVAYQRNIKSSFIDQVECGAWLDPNDHLNRSSSGFCSYSLGLKIVVPYFYAESIHGIGAINLPDGLLGGEFQFFHDVGFGINDRSENSIGLNFKHVSSAGLNNPNIGRNYLAIKVSIGI